MADDFYEDQYFESDRITTELPSDAELRQMIESKFCQHPLRSIQRLTPIFELCGVEPGSKVVDFGCSWGYMTYQFGEIGFSAEGYEISRRRAAYGRANLGVAIHGQLDTVRRNNDLFFSSHVIEHLQNPFQLIEASRKLLGQNGCAVIVCPNGGAEYRKRQPEMFHRCWGKVHPCMITPEFLAKAYQDNPYYIGTKISSFTMTKSLDPGRQELGDEMDGDELFMIVWPNRFAVRV